MNEKQMKFEAIYELGNVITRYQKNVINIEYVLLKNIKEGWEQEQIVITYKGGAISVLPANGNSFSANIRIVSEHLESGYYAEVRAYKDMLANPDIEKKTFCVSHKSFMEQLNRFNQTKDYVSEVITADEVKAQFDEYDITEEQFETLCEFVHKWYLNTEDVSIWEITNNLVTCIKNKDFTIDEIKTDYEKCREAMNRRW